MAKGAMRHFGKSRTVRASRVPEKIFVKIPEKIFGENVLGKIWGSRSMLDLKFSRVGFHGGDGSRVMRCGCWGVLVIQVWGI